MKEPVHVAVWVASAGLTVKVSMHSEDVSIQILLVSNVCS